MGTKKRAHAAALYKLGYFHFTASLNLINSTALKRSFKVPHVELL